MEELFEVIARSVLALFLLSLGGAVHAQGKRDIHGFYPGMTAADVVSRGKTIGDGKCEANRICQVDDGTLGLGFQKHAEPKLLEEVSYEFTSGTGPEEMVAFVSAQYGIPPVKGDLKRAIAYARTSRSTGLKFLGNPVTESGGQIAAWNLSDQVFLTLHFMQGQNNQYDLRLYSKRLKDSDAQARRRARELEEEKRRAVNPRPKF